MLLYQKVFEFFVGFSVLPIFYYEFNLLYRIDEYNASTMKPAPIKPKPNKMNEDLKYFNITCFP